MLYGAQLFVPLCDVLLAALCPLYSKQIYSLYFSAACSIAAYRKLWHIVFSACLVYANCKSFARHILEHFLFYDEKLLKIAL